MIDDLLSGLKRAYTEARQKDDRRAMEVAARAISYATSGERHLAVALAVTELHIEFGVL